jgi:hypothetical protein
MYEALINNDESLFPSSSTGTLHWNLLSVENFSRLEATQPPACTPACTPGWASEEELTHRGHAAEKTNLDPPRDFVHALLESSSSLLLHLSLYLHSQHFSLLFPSPLLHDSLPALACCAYILLNPKIISTVATTAALQQPAATQLCCILILASS